MDFFINQDNCMVCQHSQNKNLGLNGIDKVMLTNIKKLLKLPIRTNNSRLKIVLGLPDLNSYLLCRLLKLKEKYEYIFKEKLTIYNKIIKQVLDTEYILYFYRKINNIW